MAEKSVTFSPLTVTLNPVMGFKVTSNKDGIFIKEQITRTVFFCDRAGRPLL